VESPKEAALKPSRTISRATFTIPSPELPDEGGDELAQNEESALGLKDHQRSDRLKDALHVVAVWGLRIVAASCFVGVVVRVWHLIGPTRWLWIDPTRLQTIDHILLGVLGGFGARYFSSVMDVRK
jgi:hypothetical protein